MRITSLIIFKIICAMEVEEKELDGRMVFGVGRNKIGKSTQSLLHNHSLNSDSKSIVKIFFENHDEIFILTSSYEQWCGYVNAIFFSIFFFHVIDVFCLHWIVLLTCNWSHLSLQDFAIFTMWLQTDRQMDQWTDRPMDGWTNGWSNGCTMFLLYTNAIGAS